MLVMSWDFHYGFGWKVGVERWLAQDGNSEFQSRVVPVKGESSFDGENVNLIFTLIFLCVYRAQEVMILLVKRDHVLPSISITGLVGKSVRRGGLSRMVNHRVPVLV